MKRKSGWNQQVTDDQGRRRFHGAFTGGFSAGYYNSVGTAEGWQPTSFSSSRSNRATSTEPVQQKPEDFMDEEDDPLLGKQLQMSEKYHSVSHPQHQPDDPSTSRQQPIPAFTLPKDLIQPANNSIGKQLLNRMGWKEGHGIGPHLRRRRLTQFDNSGNQSTDDDVVYVPPRKTIEIDSFPKPKLDQYGAGFDPFVNAPEFSKRHQQQLIDAQREQRQIVTFASALNHTQGSTQSNRTAMGFGLSALEENDDLDVYSSTNMNDFDLSIGPKEKVKYIEDGTRKEVQKEMTTRVFRRCTDGRRALPGFVLASIKENQPPSKVRVGLNVPHGFRPFHVFDSQEEMMSSKVAHLYRQFNFSTETKGQTSRITATQRGQLLGESPATPSSNNNQVIDRPSLLLETTQQFRANISASIAKRFVSASSESGSDTKGMATETKKQSFRTEMDWAPHALLCKRFHVKCQGPTITDKETDVENSSDLFTTEMAPHLVEYASERRAVSDVKQEDTTTLPPLPVVSKAPSELLKSIFEPSDDSEYEDLEEIESAKDPSNQIQPIQLPEKSRSTLKHPDHKITTSSDYLSDSTDSSSSQESYDEKYKRNHKHKDRHRKHRHKHKKDSKKSKKSKKKKSDSSKKKHRR